MARKYPTKVLENKIFIIYLWEEVELWVQHLRQSCSESFLVTFSVSSSEIALRKGQFCPRRFPPRTFWQLVCNAFLLNVLFLELVAQSNCYDFTDRFGITLYISYSLFNETFLSDLTGLGTINRLAFVRFRILSYHLKCIYWKRGKYVREYFTCHFWKRLAKINQVSQTGRVTPNFTLQEKVTRAVTNWRRTLTTTSQAPETTGDPADRLMTSGARPQLVSDQGLRLKWHWGRVISDFSDCPSTVVG